MSSKEAFLNPENAMVYMANWVRNLDKEIEKISDETIIEPIRKVLLGETVIGILPVNLRKLNTLLRYYMQDHIEAVNKCEDVRARILNAQIAILSCEFETLCDLYFSTTGYNFTDPSVKLCVGWQVIVPNENAKFPGAREGAATITRSQISSINSPFVVQITQKEISGDSSEKIVH